jgi:hypothetical protein
MKEKQSLHNFTTDQRSLAIAANLAQEKGAVSSDDREGPVAVVLV